MGGGGGGGGAVNTFGELWIFLFSFFYALYILKLAYLLTMFKIYCSLIRGFEFLLAIAYLPKYSPYPQHRPPPLLPALPG